MSLHQVPCESDPSTHLVCAASEVRLHRHFAFSAFCGFPFPCQHMGCLPSRPAGTWATLPGMPEVNEAIRNGRIPRQEHGYVMKSHHFFISSILDFPAVTYQNLSSSAPLSAHMHTQPWQPDLSFLLEAEERLSCLTLIHNSQDHQPLPQCISSAIHLLQHLATITSKYCSEMSYSASVCNLYNLKPWRGISF